MPSKRLCAPGTKTCTYRSSSPNQIDDDHSTERCDEKHCDESHAPWLPSSNEKCADEYLQPRQDCGDEDRRTHGTRLNRPLSTHTYLCRACCTEHHSKNDCTHDCDSVHGHTQDRIRFTQRRRRRLPPCPERTPLHLSHRRRVTAHPPCRPRTNDHQLESLNRSCSRSNR